MKWFLIYAWVCLTYIFFAVNAVPHFFNLYKNQSHKIINKLSGNRRTQTPKEIISSDLQIKTTKVKKSEPIKKLAENQSTEQKSEPLLNILQCGIWLWILINCYLIGAGILKIFKLEGLKNSFVISIALGLGFFSYLILMIGLSGLLLKNVIFLILAMISLIFFKNLSQIVVDLKTVFKNFFGKEIKIYLSLPIIVIILLLFLRSFIPDQFYDSLQYHLALPQAYINCHKIFQLPYNFNSGMPQNAEMLFTFGLILGGDDTIPLLFQLLCGFLILTTLITESGPGNLWAALLWLTTPLVIENLRFNKNDLFLSLWITLSFFLIVNWNDKNNYRNLILSGIFSGFAMGTKYTGIFFLGFLSIILYLKMRELKIINKTKLLIIFLSVSLIPFFPWIIKNVIFFKNPFYPFFQNIFGYQMMRPQNWIAFINENHQFYNSSWNFTSIPKFLWRNTFFGYEYPSMNFIGPLWLAFLPVLLFFGAKSNKLKLFLLFILMAFLIGCTQTTLARYFFLPTLSLLSFTVIHSLFSIENIFFKKKLTFLLLFGILLQGIGFLPFLEQISFGRKAFFGLTKEKKSQLYPEGYFASVEWVNLNLSQESKLLFIGETKSHLFKIPCIAPSAHNEHLISVLLQSAHDGDDLYKKLNDLKVTHLLINASELSRLKNYPMFYLDPKQIESLFNFLEKHLNLKYQNNSITIHELAEHSDRLNLKPEEIKNAFLKLNAS